MLGNFMWRLTPKRDFQNKTRPHQLSIAINVNTMASLFRLICCSYIFYWLQVINDFIEDLFMLFFWEMVRGGMYMENSRIIPKKYHLLDHLSLILLHSLGKKP